MSTIKKADFISIDFETATSDMNSACAVGVAVVSQLKVEKCFYSLIQPPGNRYAQKNSEIHGITALDTKDAKPAFAALQDFFPYLAMGVPVIAHNATFDMSVFCKSIGPFVPDLDFKYIDTMDMVRPYRLPKRGLTDCAAYFGIDAGCHHNAADDAKTCALIAIACVQASGFDRFSDFCLYTPSVKIRQYAQLEPIESFPRKKSYYRGYEKFRVQDVCPSCTEIDPSGPFYGKTIVFTGELSISRKDAAQLAADAGAILKGSVSQKLDYLVAGRQDIDIVGADGMSGKEEKAHALNAMGKANIQIIGEDEFFALLHTTQPGKDVIMYE